MNSAELLARVAPPIPSAVLIALSGGPDSAVAAWAATQLAPGAVRALHVDHGTAAAPRLAAAATSVAAFLEVPCEVVAVEVGQGASWEAQARTARWEALRAKADPLEVIATGHHRDDLAETTLLNLMRGAGAAGLAGLAATRRDVWRPLLGVDRREVIAVADELGLPYADDPSNRDPAFARNQLRHNVMPLIEAEFGSVAGPLSRAAHLLAADDAVLESAVAEWPLSQDAWGAWRIPAALVATAEVPLASRAVRRLIRAARPPYAGTTSEVMAVLDVASGVVAGAEIGGGVHVELEGPWVVAHHGAAVTPEPIECLIPGAEHFGALEVAVVAVGLPLVRRTSLLDANAVGPSVTLRGASHGERIDITGGTKPIREVLAEAGVPVRLRSAWPVAEAHGRIVAVAGIRSAPWARGALDDDSTVELTVRELEH